MSNIHAFIRLSRLHFLIGGLLMFGLGAALARPINAGQYVIAQIMVTAAQLTAHYVNEYADFEADRHIANRTSFSGGSGVLGSGALPRVTALRAGQVTTVVALAGATAVARFSPAGAIAGVLALAVSWAYSMPPVRLLNTGFGELATSLTVAGLVPLIGAVVQCNGFPGQLWWMIAMLTPMQFAMLLAFELPDLATDAIACKRVLGVRIGARRTVLLQTVLVVIVYALDAVGYLTSGLEVGPALGALIALPIAVVMCVASARERHAITVRSAVASFFLLGVGLLVGVL